MGAVLSFFRPAPVARGDWSQQEIAEFYRVEAALTQAGLRVTTDRGLSDEDDPWFVFCRFDGDVILHFARIDGLYVVASEAFERPLQGPDFRALLNAVAAEHPTLVPLPRPDAQGARGNLVLHPAALLAAIVATVAFQLAGGDAMAGELATDDSPAPMLQPGTDGTDLGSFTPYGPSDNRGEAVGDPSYGQPNEDEGRHARHALILSALALIGASLPSEHTAPPGLALLNDGGTTGSQGRTTSKQVPEADAVRENVLAQKRAEASADAAVAEVGMEPAALVRAGLNPTSPTHVPANVEGVNFAALNILSLGPAGGQEIAAVRAAESAPSATAFFAMRGAARASSVAVSVEKAAPPPSVAESSPAATASQGATAATPVSAPATTGGQAGITTASASEIGSAPSAPATSATNASGTLSTSSASSATVKTAGAVAVPEASHTTTSVAANVPTASVQTASVTSVTYTANTLVRSALNAFITQYATDSAGTGSVDVGSAVKALAADPWLTAWAKSIGSRTGSDVLGSLITYTTGVSPSPKESGSLVADQVGVTSKSLASVGATITPSQSAAVTGATTGSEDKGALLTTGSLAAVGSKATTGLLNAGSDATPSNPAGTINSTGVTAGSDKAGTGVDKILVGTPTADGTDKSATAPLSAADKTTTAQDTHTTTGSVAATDKVAAGTDVPFTGTSPTTGADKVSTGNDKVAAGTGTTAIGSDNHIKTDTSVTVTDKVGAGTTASTATDKISAGDTTEAALKAHTGTGTTTAPDKVLSGTTSTPAPATEKFTAGTGTDTTVLDTTKLKLPAFVASAPVLDDRGRELIARFLDATAQVQTIVTEHSFVMIDMDASHYTSPDFVLRTWNIGHNVEISIVGLASDAYLTHAAGLAH